MTETARLDRNHRVAFKVIRAMHDGFLANWLVDPAQILSSLGLKRGDTVLDIGCGPGFYAAGASRVVGPEGRVYAYDINPYSIRYVIDKDNRLGLTNVIAEERNASDTELPDSSVDFAFLIGVPRVAGGLYRLLAEASRVIKLDGLLVVRPRPQQRQEVVEAMGDHGFSILQVVKRYRVFAKTELSGCVH